MATIPLPAGSALFVGRASGPSLAIGKETSSCAAYGVPMIFMSPPIQVIHSELPQSSCRCLVFELAVPGVYTLEVLQLFQTFNVDEFSANKSMCTVEPARMTRFVGRVMVMQDDSVVTPALELNRSHESHGLPRFVWAALPPQQSQQMLWTRVQDCHHLKGSRAAALGYTKSGVFDAGQGGSTVTKLLSRAQPAHSNYLGMRLTEDRYVPVSTAQPPCKLPAAAACCIIGASHARNLCAKIPGCVNIWHRFASEPIKERTVAACKGTVFLHLGQWDAGWPAAERHHETTFTPLAKFKDAIHTLVSSLEGKFPGRVAVMIMNHVPLSCLITQCPIRDWRGPPVIDAFNKVMGSAAKTLNVPFMDNTDVVGPMWDAADDFNHPSAHVLGVLVWRTLEHMCRSQGVLQVF